MMSAKLATLALFKWKVNWNKGYEVIIVVHDVTNKILSLYSNYIWPKFDNARIFMTEVIVTSILSGFHQKIQFFRGMLLVQVQ